MELKEIYDLMHGGKIYDPTEPTLIKVQTEKLERLYEFDHTRPSEGEKRQEMLKTMFAEIGENCYIEPPLYANFGGAHVHFGSGVYANFGLTLVDDTYIYVGNNVMIGPHVTIATAAHPVSPEKRKKGLQYNLPVRIGDNCWLGAGVIVLPGVTIGENTVVGAGSVVTKDLPANVVAVGVPCRVIREITEKDE